MIHDSQRCFEILWLNSLLSWAFSGQDKNMKISGIINGSVTFKWYESYLNTSSTELCWILCSFFLYWFFHVWYEIKWHCAFTEHTTQKSITKSHELLLPTSMSWYYLHTSISPFDIKCKNLNSKYLWKCIFSASRRVSF